MQAQKLQTKEHLMIDIADAWCLQRHSRKGEGITVTNNNSCFFQDATHWANGSLEKYVSESVHTHFGRKIPGP